MEASVYTPEPSKKPLSKYQAKQQAKFAPIKQGKPTSKKRPFKMMPTCQQKFGWLKPWNKIFKHCPKKTLLKIIERSGEWTLLLCKDGLTEPKKAYPKFLLFFCGALKKMQQNGVQMPPGVSLYEFVQNWAKETKGKQNAAEKQSN